LYQRDLLLVQDLLQERSRRVLAGVRRRDQRDRGEEQVHADRFRDRGRQHFVARSLASNAASSRKHVRINRRPSVALMREHVGRKA
jgi:hypothetical protein